MREKSTRLADLGDSQDHERPCESKKIEAKLGKTKV